MAYGEDPTGNNLDAIRLLVGDTDTSDELLSDIEINFYLTQTSNLMLAASMAADAIASGYARMIDSEVDEIRALASQRYNQYRSLSQRLAERSKDEALGGLASTPTGVFAGGLSIAGTRSERNASDRVPARFRRDLHTNSNDPDYHDGTQDIADFGSS